MAIFESNIVQTSAITTSAALIWDPSNSSTSTFGPRGAVPVLTPAQTLTNVTIVNQGPAVLFIGGSTVTAATGLSVPVGAQVTIEGYTATAGSTTGRIYGITSSGTANVAVGLETTNATV